MMLPIEVLIGWAILTIGSTIYLVFLCGKVARLEDRVTDCVKMTYDSGANQLERDKTQQTLNYNFHGWLTKISDELVLQKTWQEQHEVRHVSICDCCCMDHPVPQGEPYGDRPNMATVLGSNRSDDPEGPTVVQGHDSEVLHEHGTNDGGVQEGHRRDAEGYVSGYQGPTST